MTIERNDITEGNVWPEECRDCGDLLDPEDISAQDDLCAGCWYEREHRDN